MELNYLKFEQEDAVGILSFNRPEVLNALNTKVLVELDEAMKWLDQKNDVHVIIITGQGKAFVAGADIKEMVDKTPEEGRQFGALGAGVFRNIELMEKPVIAAVNGFALGGGCELAMCCDIRLASEKAKFGQPEVSLGITPGFAGTQRLSRLVGVGHAKEMIFTGKIISAGVAEKLGLVNHVFPAEDLISEAISMAKAITKNAQLAVRYSKSAINRGIDIDFDSASEIEKTYFGLSFATEDQKEGMQAFLEKRPGNFKIK